jgi:excisionase family DNA binding protein
MARRRALSTPVPGNGPAHVAYSAAGEDAVPFGDILDDLLGRGLRVQPIGVRLHIAARLIGVHRNTLLSWCAAGKIPHRRVENGKHTTLLFNLEELQRWTAGRDA